MSDDGVMAAIREILKHRGHIGYGDVRGLGGGRVVTDDQARRVLDVMVRRGLIQRAKGGGFVAGGWP